MLGADGTAPYEYSINGSNFNTTGFFDGLTVGVYSVRVRDASGCQITVGVTITEPTLLTVAVQSKTNVDCHSNTTGSITLVATGGSLPYEFADASAVYDIVPSLTTLAQACTHLPCATAMAALPYRRNRYPARSAYAHQSEPDQRIVLWSEHR